MKKILNKSDFLPKWLLLMVTIFLALAIIFFGLAGFYQLNYKDKLYWGVELGDLSLVGKTKEQARALIQAKIDKLANEGMEFDYRDNKLIVEPIISSGSETGLAYELWLFDADKIADDLYSLGRRGKWLENIGEQVKLFLFGSSDRVSYVLKEDELESELKRYFSQWESPAQQADLIWQANQVEIIEEESGLVFDYQGIIKLVRQNLERIDNRKIEMGLRVDNPEVTKAEAAFLLPEVEQVLRLAPLSLNFEKPEYYQGRKRFSQTGWQINKTDLINWLKIKYADKSPDNSDRVDEGMRLLVLGIDKEVASKYLKGVADIINTPAYDAKFEIKDGRVTEWQSSEDGFTINIDETINQIEQQLIKQRKNQVKLVLSVDKSKIANENVNNLGINELVGVGESNFRGSPMNRRHNIAVGAETLNGLLIKPNEEFSLLEALGEVNAATGYKPELVIKKGETVPEYGGGLCQIGTTMFRLAINSGLEITQRRNHSYRVSYYEPAGTDATIYDPWPDFKFINDIQSYLLLQTRIEGDNLIFEFWGTSDGRQVTTTTPAIYNIISPGEPEYIETTELEPGEKRRIEYAHNGADTHFTRTISWPEELGRELVEEVWTSHYVPWRERWLIGVAELSTSTEEVIGD